MNHTKEPWLADAISFNEVDIVNDEFVIAEELTAANAHRIVQCINDCAGIEDPKGYMDKLKEDNDRLSDEIYVIEEVNKTLSAKDSGYRKIISEFMKATESILFTYDDDADAVERARSMAKYYGKRMGVEYE